MPVHPRKSSPAFTPRDLFGCALLIATAPSRDARDAEQAAAVQRLAEARLGAARGAWGGCGRVRAVGGDAGRRRGAGSRL
eukprot:4962855-Prymnesium_polylepis.1